MTMWTSILFEGQFPAHSGLRECKAKLSVGGVIDSRAPAVLAHAAVSFKPRRWFVGILHPVNDRRFVAPVQQAWHRAPMCPRHHEGAHRCFVAPDRTCPVHATAITQQRHREICWCGFGLPRGPQSINKKARNVSPRPNTQAGNGYERHDGSPRC